MRTERIIVKRNTKYKVLKIEVHGIYAEYMEEIPYMELQYIAIQSFTLIMNIMELTR